MADSHGVGPSAWAVAYVGLPYVLGVGECSHRAALVWRQEFGLDIEVPAAFGDLNVAQTLLKAELAKPDWVPVRRPAEGDAVIMWKGDRLAHVGVWVAPGHVLHCTRAEGMVLTPEADLPAQGFRIFGYFRHRMEQAAAA
ncbi:hypothetical protein [Rubellimicrobium arenae]|uniref:hypothetical protein n=1 Tax=Rubellimicrobium arenae TaxID=2817372 RepID=UPI001B312498|nr:hypothetical protein [Rubellimicrobium arenae]